MDEHRSPLTLPPIGGLGHPFRFRDLLHRFLLHSNQAFTRADFLRLSTAFLMDFCRADVVEIRIAGPGRTLRCRGAQDGGNSRIELDGPVAGPPDPGSPTERILLDVLEGRFSAPPPFSSRNGSFWIGDTTHPILLRDRNRPVPVPTSLVLGGDLASLVIVPVPVDDETRGVLLLGSTRAEFFPKEDLPFFEAAGETLGVAMAFQAAQWALRERVKELTCLYGIANIARTPGLDTVTLLHEIAALLPEGWQYPDITSTVITFDGVPHATPNHDRVPPELSARSLRATITVNGQPRGFVEVAYHKEMPEHDEGPFLKEERSLIDEIARQIGFIIEHREDEQEKARLRAELQRFHLGRQPDASLAD